MRDIKTNSGAEALKESNFKKHIILATREERDVLLRSGFTGKQVEALYVVLNGITVIGDMKTNPSPMEDKGAYPPLSSPVIPGVRA